MKTKILSIATIIILCCSYVVNTYAATTGELESQKEDLQSKVTDAKNQLQNLQDQETVTQDELTIVNTELSALTNEIAGLQAQLDALNESIEAKEKEISEKEQRVAEKQELLKKRLLTMYKKGGSTYIDVLLGSSNYIEMLINYDAVKEIAEIDNKLIDQIVEEKEKLQAAKKELEEQKKEVDEVKSAKDAKSVELTEKQSEKQEKIKQLNAEQQATQEEIDSYNAAMARVNEELAEAFRRAQEEMERRSSGGGGSSGGSGINFDGSFIWPCNCNIVTSLMKWRWGRMHKGIDIGADYESVYASASGICYNAYDDGGYGNYIMIFHGDGYVTLYGHLNYSVVSDGQYVRQGETIAQSGNTGGSTGPHLHFEIRNASSISEFFSESPLDPLDYLPGGYVIDD